MTSKKETPPPKPPLKDEQGDVALKNIQIFKSPSFYFFVLLIPIFLSVLVTFTAKPPEEKPKKEIVQPAAPVYVGSSALVQSPSTRIRKMARGNDTDFAPVPGGVALPKTGCNLKHLIGKTPDAALAARIKESGRTYRTLQPGSAMTMDYSEGRINLELDDKGVIRRIWCG